MVTHRIHWRDPCAIPSIADGTLASPDELGGLRLPKIAMPLATYTPWNLRAAEIGAAREMADFVGASLPFPLTRTGAVGNGDPVLHWRRVIRVAANTSAATPRLRSSSSGSATS